MEAEMVRIIDHLRYARSYAQKGHHSMLQYLISLAEMEASDLQRQQSHVDAEGLVSVSLGRFDTLYGDEG